MIPSEFKGRAIKATQDDIASAAAEIEVGPSEFGAVLDVEAAGKAFDKSGRPSMLFEPHIFYRQLSGKPDLQAKAVQKGLAYVKWGEKPYPPESYTQIANAMLIDRQAALRAASWGSSQIMGFHATDLGYASAEAMVAIFCDNESEHLRAMALFIRQNNLDSALRNHDWRAFARGYNGSGYEKNAYHTKLAAAYEKRKSAPKPEAVSVAVVTPVASVSSGAAAAAASQAGIPPAGQIVIGMAVVVLVFWLIMRGRK